MLMPTRVHFNLVSDLMRVKKIYSRQGAASKMFCDSGANSSFSPVDFSSIGKFTHLGLILTLNTFSCVFAIIPPSFAKYIFAA
jgi:hypothetical protein